MNKKKAWITASILSSVFAAAVYVEGTGYAPFDSKSGENLLCKIDPSCRQLTQGEKQLASKFFSNSINYSAVKIFDRPLMGLFGKNTPGFSPNGNIYFVEQENQSGNFASSTLDHTMTFIHEMTHVAQHQSGINLPWQALMTYLTYEYKYDDAYDYRIETRAPFSLMNLEQQANIMEDYFLQRHQFEEMTTRTSRTGDKISRTPQNREWMKARCRELAQYEEKLNQEFPVRPDELCLPKPAAPKP